MMSIDILNILLTIPAAVISICIHEYMKAAASTRLGDQIPKNKGYLTLNPLKHLEPIGFICMLIFGLGWGRGTETSSVYYRDRRSGVLITYTLPILVNVLVGCIFAVILYFFKPFVANADNIDYISMTMSVARMQGMDAAALCLYYAFYKIARCNISLAIFSIIPVSPLAGSKILSALLPPGKVVRMSAYDKILQLILFMLLFFGYINMLIDPITNAILWFVN